MTYKDQTQQQALLTLAHYNYEKGLTAHALFKVHDHAVCQDLVQDTFMKTWKYLVRGGKIELMKAFLYHVLNHLIVDEYRKNKSMSLDVLVEKGFDFRINDSDRLFNYIDGKAALLLISRLPPHYQSVMRMRYIQNLSLEEISSATGFSKNSIAVKAHRGLEKLRTFYKTV